jgi:hypothetical protein
LIYGKKYNNLIEGYKDILKYITSSRRSMGWEIVSGRGFSCGAAKSPFDKRAGENFAFNVQRDKARDRLRRRGTEKNSQ